MLLLALSLFVGLASANYFGNYNCEPGRDVVVHLFEWKWTDIQKECEFLAEKGYCALQVSPPGEHRIITEEDWGHPYPWYQRYQAVSYKLESRSGTEAEFVSMVETCNDLGVRVYGDVIINHMTGDGSGIGSGGSAWDGDTESYPDVPFSQENFHGPDVCHSFDGNVHDYMNPEEVRYCRLFGLRDLRASDDYVQEKLAGYLNKLIDYGVAGFRVDAAKYNFPIHIEEIMDRCNELNTRWFPAGTKPYVYNEVIDTGNNEPIKGEHYEHIGRVTDFNYGFRLGEVFRRQYGQRLAYLRTFGESWGLLKNESALVFVDNHDTQRGHGPGGLGNIINFHDPREYTMANAYMLAWDFGHVRVMSSYWWDQQIDDGVDINDWWGPPSDDQGNTNDVDCDADWICEHRWLSIANMVRFHNLVMGEPIQDWWDNGNDAIAFSRGSKGFIAINNEPSSTVTETVVTGLPSGDYCDVITCDTARPPCTGGAACKAPYTVSNGQVSFSIHHTDANGVIALHV